MFQVFISIVSEGVLSGAACNLKFGVFPFFLKNRRTSFIAILVSFLCELMWPSMTDFGGRALFWQMLYSNSDVLGLLRW